ncbi:branched-chain amino acid aminotransferase [Halarchaeum rubridurum]|uniref:4-amino-4-deoxychorismate lyase n=1 Tax=Halarchaeum rubridurum TaxID=489911 RepID=A0A830FYL3_9EURY|nr:aminotransferase class IV [Halarchaeum rubridurum]MBP1954522.1 branched-chain amino acid aminotransferase [Halarchaeum rubridurum]GGM61797.1 4-amino-4-deoxychorismate lyase [Halarchaeum rubridurum]
MQYHVDGALVDADAATVSVADRGFRYGDAAFETLRAYGGTVFRWDDHAARLRDTLDALGFERYPDAADLRGRVAETLAANDLDDAYVRVSVTRGAQSGKLTPGPADPTVVVVTKPLSRGGTDGDDVWDAPASARVVETRRVPDAAIPAAAKTHNYLNGVLARNELDGEDEALMCDVDGHLAEGATSNVFWVSDGTLRTPTLDGDVLPGVTRRVVLELAEREGVDIETGTYDPDALRRADEAFLTNTTWELRPLVDVDGTALPVGPLTERLAGRFDALVESTHY